MDWYRKTIMGVPQADAKPDSKKLRKKLQKAGNQQRHSHMPTTGTEPHELLGFNYSALDDRKSRSSGIMIPSKSPSRPPQPDLSDSKWVAYTRESGCAPSKILKSSLKSDASLSPSSKAVPEFAHLSMDMAKHRNSFDMAIENTCSPRSSVASGMRRRAKTPILSIGQLEGPPARLSIPQQNGATGANIELIAASYRALLESRCSILSDKKFDASESIYEDFTPEPCSPRRPDDTPRETVLDIPNVTQPDTGSPSSENGTLVGFEDTIYFKPVSYEPRPIPSSPNPQSNGHTKNMASIASTRVEDPSLHLCVDLLTRELSSAVSGSPQRPNAETSALQIWVMIEAYEKLRDQVCQSGLGDAKTKSAQAMFDMWLQALYTMHEEMMGNDGQQSESNYGDE